MLIDSFKTGEASAGAIVRALQAYTKSKMGSEAFFHDLTVLILRQASEFSDKELAYIVFSFSKVDPESVMLRALKPLIIQKLANFGLAELN